MDWECYFFVCDSVCWFEFYFFNSGVLVGKRVFIWNWKFFENSIKNYIGICLWFNDIEFVISFKLLLFVR